MSMPFDRYLANSHGDDTDSSNSNAGGYYDTQQMHPNSDAHHASYNTPQSAPHSSGVQFQLPPFMYTGPPTLAPGGGAEVLQAGMFSGPGGNWLANSGFSHAAGSQSVVSDANAAYGTALDSFLRHSENVGYGADPSGAWGAGSASSVDAPSAFGLPVYSASGFDLLGILGRVVNRPSPKIHLGPVDMTCSFVVTDTRRYDHPIVYASQTFCSLTGYSESEILGRNCRFLQSPDGRLVKGEERRFTSPEAVNLMRKSLMADKECQTSLVNYKKGGQAFINLVTVIPVGGGINDTPEERDTVCYHVGFQVDLTQQPNAILERLKDGSYMVNYSKEAAMAPTIRRPLAAPNAQTFVPMSTELRHLLSDANFTSSLPLSTAANVILNSPKPESYDDHELLNLLLLETLPDFVHVLSLKGVFLYVAPSVRRVLGYEPEELVGKSISDFCHDADLVPLMRELKESSAMPTAPGTDDPAGGTVVTGPQSVQAVLVGPGPGGPPKTVDLLFRIRAKHGGYVWLDCRGRLHVEPGKGRKAIIMSGRRRGMPRLAWSSVAAAGGVAPSLVTPPGHMDTIDLPGGGIGGTDTSPGAATVEKTSALEREFWAKVSREGTVLFVGAGARDVLGWGAGELIGRPLADFIDSSAATNGMDMRQAFLRALANVVARPMSPSSSSLAQQLDVRETENVSLEMSRKSGERVSVDVVLYRSQANSSNSGSSQNGAPTSTEEQWPHGPLSSLTRGGIPPAPVVVQVRLASMTGTGRLTRDGAAGVFEELETRRGTSWQYELQQLKYANRRLADEVAALEASGAGNPTGAALSQAGEGAGRDENGPDSWRTRAGMKRSWDGVDGEGASG